MRWDLWNSCGLKPACLNASALTWLLTLFPQLFGAIFAINAGAAQKITAHDPESPSEVHGGRCANLLAMADQTSALSLDAKVFLGLIDIGLQRFGPELPGFLSNLRDLPRINHPHNPFINLNTHLATALAQRAETLLHGLGPCWRQIVEILSLRVLKFQSVQNQRAQDQQETRSVLSPVDLLNPWAKFGLRDLGAFAYIGETKEYLVFSVHTTLHDVGEEYSAIVLRLSKYTREGAIVAKIHPVRNTDHYTNKLWMHGGLVYGFGYREKLQTQEEIRAPQIFRVDPETSEIAWADQWAKIEPNHFPSRFLFRLHVSNSIVGVDWCSDGAKIYRFDYDQFRMIPTGLVCRDPDGGRGARWERQAYFSSGLYANGPLRIGRVFKTDGRVLVKADNSRDWKHWSPEEAFISEKSAYREGKYVWNQTTISLHETQFDFESLDIDSHLEKLARKPIVFSVPLTHSDRSNANMDEVFESLDGGRSLVYLLSPGAFGARFIPKLFLIDRHSWTATKIDLTGGRFEEKDGRWRLLRNQRDDVLLELTVADHEVALWKFDPVSKRFELKVHEVVQKPEMYLTISAMLDYENLRFVAWIYRKRQMSSGLGLRVLLPESLSRP